MNREVIRIDVTDKGQEYDELGVKPSDRQELMDMGAELSVTIDQLATIGTMSYHRGDSDTPLLGCDKEGLFLGKKVIARGLFRQMKKIAHLKSGKEVEVRAYDIQQGEEVQVEEGEPDQEGVYAKSYRTPDSAIPKKSVYSSDDAKAVTNAERYIRNSVVGHFKDRLYRIAVYGKQGKAVELCDYLIEEVRKIRKDILAK